MNVRGTRPIYRRAPPAREATGDLVLKGPAGEMSDDDEVNTGVEGKAEELTRNVVDKFAEAKRHSDLAHAEERARRRRAQEDSHCRASLYYTTIYTLYRI